MVSVMRSFWMHLSCVTGSWRTLWYIIKEDQRTPDLQPEQEAKQKEWLEKRMEGRRHKDEVSDVFECIRTNSKRIQARKLFDYNIVLIGFMGTGKSTISDSLRMYLPWMW